MPTVRDVLSTKSAKVHTTRPSSTVLDAVQLMNQYGIGALVVMDAGRVVGMFTERDVLRRVVGADRRPADMFVAEVMSTEVVFIGPQEDIDDVRTTLKNRRIRHLPVCQQDGDLVGLVSMGDLNAFEASNREATIHFLNEYIYGRV